MSQRSTELSSITYHSPLLACKKRHRHLEMKCRVSQQKHRQKTAAPRVHQNKSNPAPKETSSPKALAASNTTMKICLPQHRFFPCEEGSCSLPLCSSSSVLQDSWHPGEPGQRTRSRGGVLQLSETCMGEDPSTRDTPQTTERPRGLRNDP